MSQTSVCYLTIFLASWTTVAASEQCSINVDGKSTCQETDQNALLQGRVHVLEVHKASFRQDETWLNMFCPNKEKFATVGKAKEAFTSYCAKSHPASLCSAVLDAVFKELKDKKDEAWSPDDKLCKSIDDLIMAEDDNKALLLDRSGNKSCLCPNSRTNAPEPCLRSQKDPCAWLGGKQQLNSGSTAVIAVLAVLVLFPLAKRFLGVQSRPSSNVMASPRKCTQGLDAHDHENGRYGPLSIMTGERRRGEIEKYFEICTLQDCIERNAIVMPTAAALIQPDGHIISFMELEKWAACIAYKVSDAGIGLSSGSAIGVAAVGCSLVAGIIGVWK